MEVYKQHLIQYTNGAVIAAVIITNSTKGNNADNFTIYDGVHNCIAAIHVFNINLNNNNVDMGSNSDNVNKSDCGPIQTDIACTIEEYYNNDAVVDDSDHGTEDYFDENNDSVMNDQYSYNHVIYNAATETDIAGPNGEFLVYRIGINVDTVDGI